MLEEKYSRTPKPKNGKRPKRPFFGLGSKILKKGPPKKDPKNPHFWQKPQKPQKRGGSKKGSFFRILVPFFGLSVGIPALKKWGGYPIFRSILRRVADPQKRGVFGTFFGGPGIPYFWDLFWPRPKGRTHPCFWFSDPIPKPRRGFGIER